MNWLEVADCDKTFGLIIG